MSVANFMYLIQIASRLVSRAGVPRNEVLRVIYVSKDVLIIQIASPNNKARKDVLMVISH